MTKHLERIGVIGAGTTGHGITQACAASDVSTRQRQAAVPASCFEDVESRKTLILLTNNAFLLARTIRVLHKIQRKLELFFKSIKQHLPINR